MRNQHQYDIDVVTSRSVLETMANEWDTLAKHAGMPTVSYAWVVAGVEAFHAEDQLSIVTVRRKGELVGLAPLVECRRGLAPRLELIGVSFLYEPAGFLYRDHEAMTCLVEAVLERQLPMVLARMSVDSPVMAQLRSGLFTSSGGFVMKGGLSYSLMIPIVSEWTAYLEKLSPRRRYDLRRARRRAEEAGPVTVRIFCPKDDELEAGMADFIRIEGRGWKGRQGSSLQQRENMRRFFERYAALASPSGTFRFAFLDVAGIPIAAQLAAVYANRYWVFKIGYDEAWGRCSPGWQLLGETIKYAFEQKLTSYEFLGSDESWLHGWVTERRGYQTVSYYPFTWQGLYGVAVDAVGRIKDRFVGTKKAISSVAIS
ncbi:MAG: GNAT family N-acetyltransferase [Nitrospira sp.]